MMWPPSTTMVWPDTKPARSDTRYSAVPTRSSGLCSRERARAFKKLCCHSMGRFLVASVITKPGAMTLTRTPCGPHNVRVNVIAPGFVITDATKNRPIEWQQSFLKARAISREQRPEDLVGTALYLLSDLAGFVSGQTIVVDGGHIMY